MSFTEKFQSFVCAGDTITCEVDGYTVTARIEQDDCPDRPDQRQDGFWPSLNPKDAGFIGTGKSQDDLIRELAETKEIMRGWQEGEWFYCGIILSLERAGVMLDPHATSLWGIDANHPLTDNSYLATVSNELLPEALTAGATALARLVATEPEQRDDIVFRRFTGNANGWIGAVKNARLVGEDYARFAAIFDEDGAPVIIERRTKDADGWSQILPDAPDFETISTRLILLWDDVMLEALA